MAIKWTLKYEKDGQPVGAYDVYVRSHMAEDVAALACEYDRVTVTKSCTMATNCLVYVKQRDMHYVIIDGVCQYYARDYKMARKFYMAAMKAKKQKGEQ